MRSVGRIITAKLSPACVPRTVPKEMPVLWSTSSTASGSRPRSGRMASVEKAMAISTHPKAASPGCRWRIQRETIAAPAASPTRKVVSIAAKA